MTLRWRVESGRPSAGCWAVGVVDDPQGLSTLGVDGLPSALLAQARDDGFTGKLGSTHTLGLGGDTPSGRVVLVGLGKPADMSLDVWRRFGATLARRLTNTRWPRVAVLLPTRDGNTADTAQAVTEGYGMGAYVFDRHRSVKSPVSPVQDVTFWVPTDKTAEVKNRVARGRVFAEAVNRARDMINEPPSLKTPDVVGRWARSNAGGPVVVDVYRKNDLVKMGAGGLLGVNRGSAHPPVLIHLRYKPSGAPRRRVAFVGKGITFDSGGLSLKSADGMMTMKYDMAGAATVISLFGALKELAPRVEVHGVCAVTENMPGPDAYKPGDVVRAMNGKTIEVLNTDAEGRVVLADALSFASRLPVDEIVDVATLTGAATVALGKAYAALMSDVPSLADGLRAAAAAAGEKLWPLPLEASYKEHIQSKVADLKNIGNPGEAGTIIGGLFLSEFVTGKPWAHIDMAGVGWNGAGSPLSVPGATGALVRTFLNHILAADKVTSKRRTT